MLAAGLVLRFEPGVPVALALLGAAYLALLGFEGNAVDARAALVAGALFATAELAYWSLELRKAVADEPGTSLRRVASVAGLVLGVIALGTALLALAESVPASGAGLTLLGAAAAVVAVALLAGAARRA